MMACTWFFAGMAFNRSSLYVHAVAPQLGVLNEGIHEV